MLRIVIYLITFSLFAVAVSKVVAPSAVLSGSCESTADLVSAVSSDSDGCRVSFIVRTLFAAESGSEAAQVSTPGEAQVECPRRRADGKIPTQAMAKGALDDAALGAPNGRCWHVKGSGAVAKEPGGLVAAERAWAWRWHSVLVTAACAPLRFLVSTTTRNDNQDLLPGLTVGAGALVGAAAQTFMSATTGYSAAASVIPGLDVFSSMWAAVVAVVTFTLALCLNAALAAGTASISARFRNGGKVGVCCLVFPWYLFDVVTLVIRLMTGAGIHGVLFCAVYYLAWGMSTDQANALAATVSTAQTAGLCWLMLLLDVWVYLVRFVL